MAKFRKKPVVIEAVRWTGRTIEGNETLDWLREALNIDPTTPGGVIRLADEVHIGTLEGIMVASPGDWIIRGIEGELYPCKPDIFAATYEPEIDHEDRD